jgi:hypothetical protein
MVGLVIAVVSLWREVGPLRAEVANLRAEMGHIRVVDSQRPHGIAIATSEPNSWKWRVYLPPLPYDKYYLNCYSGLEAPITSENVAGIVDRYRRMADQWTVRSLVQAALEGELTIEGKIIERDGHHYLELVPIGGTAVRLDNDWLPLADKTSILGGLSSHGQTELGWGEPVLLLCLQSEPRVQSTPQRGRWEACLTVMLWIHSRR